MNFLTTAGGISEALKRRYGISDERPVLTLATDLFPTINVQDGAIPDLAFVAGVRIAGAAGYTAASAGEYSGVYLRNPTGSGVIATLRHVFTANIVNVKLYYDDPGTVGSALGVGSLGILDTRSGTSGTVHQLTACQVRLFATATPGGVGVGQFPANVRADLPIVLVPGTAVSFFHPTANTANGTYLCWQERTLQKWEDFRTI